MAALLRSGIVLGCLIFSIAGLAQTAAPTKSCTGAGPSKGTVKSRCARVMCVCASPPRSATAYKNAVTLIEGEIQQVDRTRLEVIHYRGGGMSVSSPHAALRRSFQITNAQYNGVVYSSDLLMYPDTCAISDGKGCPAVIVGDEISIQWWQEFSSSIGWPTLVFQDVVPVQEYTYIVRMVKGAGVRWFSTGQPGPEPIVSDDGKFTAYTFQARNVSALNRNQEPVQRDAVCRSGRCSLLNGRWWQCDEHLDWASLGDTYGNYIAQTQQADSSLRRLPQNWVGRCK